jgi:hypothetical protein
MPIGTIGRYYFVLFVQHPVTVGRKFVTSTLDDLLKFLRRDAGASDDSYPQPGKTGRQRWTHTSYPYPNRDTTTDRDTVTEDQVQGNETLMR